MGHSHKQVIKAFKDGKARHGSRIFADWQNLYSFGTHYVLATRGDKARNKKTGEDWFLLNGDKFSNSTSRHQGLTYEYFKDYPRISFTALRAADLSPHDVTVIDWEGDIMVYSFPSYDNFNDFQKTMPMGAEYHEERDTAGNVKRKYYHRIGGVVLEANEKYFICGMDEGSYFISRLPGPVNTVKEAYEALKPHEVLEAEKAGIDIVRQGEWFFIPADMKIKGVEFLKSKSLPSGDSAGNLHIATRLKEIDGRFYVKGCVRHKDRWGGRGDHKMVKLGDGIFQAVMNTSLGNWSSGGRVD